MDLLKDVDRDFDSFIKIETDVIFKNGILIKDNKQIINNKFHNFFDEQISKFDKPILINETYDFPVFITYHSWCWNYLLNYTDCMYNLIFLSKIKQLYPNIKFCVPDNYVNNFYIEVFDILGIDIHDCLRLKGTSLFKTCIYSTAYKKYDPFSITNPYTLYITHKIRDHFSGICSTPKDKTDFIYLDRLNNLAGANRYIVNNNSIITLLEKHQFKTITVEYFNLKNKYEHLMNSKVLITAIGANMVNLFFVDLKHIEKIILLSNNAIHYKWVSDHINILCYFTGIKKENVHLIVGKKAGEPISHDVTNFPYEINLDELYQHLV